MKWLAALATVTGLCLTPAAHALDDSNIVDVELVLAVDVSLSMSLEELEIQRRGYAAALSDPAVIAAIGKGAYQRIAVTYFEWAGDTSHRVVVPWRLIASPQDARAMADALMASEPRGARRTSISGAIRESERLLAESGYRGLKRVIDISGDGPNNQGEPVVEARDAVVAQGIIVNGLPLMTSSGYGAGFNIPDLDRYYAECVIGGPGSFTVPVTSWEEFPDAVRRKLIQELAGVSRDDGEPSLIRAAAEESYDCLIGERLWMQRRGWWGDGTDDR